MFADVAFTRYFFGRYNMKKFLGLMMVMGALSFLTLGATGCKDTKGKTKTTTTGAATPAKTTTGEAKTTTPAEKTTTPAEPKTTPAEPKTTAAEPKTTAAEPKTTTAEPKTTTAAPKTGKTD